MTTSTSEISNTYRRQVLCSESIFRWKEVPSSGDSILNSDSTKKNFCQRRVIHIDYAEVFGNMVLPEFQPSTSAIKKELVSIPAPPSPEYEQTVIGLSDESLKYFPRRRRGCSRVTAKIIKNLSSEFDKLAEDPSNVIGTGKNYLQVPPVTYAQFSNKEKEQGNKMNTGFTAGGNSRDENDNNTTRMSFLRRKPIFKVEKDATKTTTEDGDKSCVIS